MRATFFSTVFVLFAAGCATAPESRDLAASIASVNTAEKLGASQVPEAAKALESAKHEVAWARALLVNGKHGRAQLMAERAETDAALAIALVHLHEARRAIKQAAPPGAAAPIH